MKSARILAVAAGVCLVASSLAHAENYQPSQYLELVRVHVKPGATAQFEEYIKKLAEAANKVNAPQHWVGGSVFLGAEGNTYVFGIQFQKWEEVDSWTMIPDMLVKAFGEKDGGAILRSGQSAIEETHTRVFRYLEDQSSTIATTPAEAKAFRFTVTHVKPDRIFAYNEAMVKARKAANETPNAPKVIRRVSTDGPSFTYLSVIPMKTYKERDSWLGPGDPILKVYGEYEGRKIIDTILGSMESNMSLVVTNRPDLSRPPIPAATN